MKTIRKKCLNGYRHYWVRLNGEVTEVGSAMARMAEGNHEIQWDREILLECARCDMRIYVDSIVRTYLGVKSGDWGT